MSARSPSFVTLALADFPKLRDTDEELR